MPKIYIFGRCCGGAVTTTEEEESRESTKKTPNWTIKIIFNMQRKGEREQARERETETWVHFGTQMKISTDCVHKLDFILPVNL